MAKGWADYIHKQIQVASRKRREIQDDLKRQNGPNGTRYGAIAAITKLRLQDNYIASLRKELSECLGTD